METIYEVVDDMYYITTDVSKLDVNVIHQFLSEESYWAEKIPKSIVEKAIANSLCFGLFYKDAQIGFARLVTDKATFAYLADVFIDANYQGKGLGKWLIETILAHPDLQGLRRILLATKDAHKLYEQCGFTSINNPERYMVYNPAGYKSK